ncbi:hypothetical protein SAMN05660226_02081 [Parapedobacter luteus]|uniref:Uncharacterized protein n=1 Tax=Parapedobacter luteus TaxID=623280 RepID=A0A1T5CCQ2_9SPHI|nr:hypothetical protein SAMN05660226_02081 [Parapedobacter luteus]
MASNNLFKRFYIFPISLHLQFIQLDYVRNSFNIIKRKIL